MGTLTIIQTRSRKSSGYIISCILVYAYDAWSINADFVPESVICSYRCVLEYSRISRFSQYPQSYLSYSSDKLNHGISSWCISVLYHRLRQSMAFTCPRELLTRAYHAEVGKANQMKRNESKENKAGKLINAWLPIRMFMTVFSK